MLDVIIAEDDVPVSVHLSNAISKNNNVRCKAILNDGTYVYQKIKEEKPDILILDLKMPGKSGLEILDEIEGDSTITTQVIVYSGELEYMASIKNYNSIYKFISKVTPIEEIGKQLHDIELEKSRKKLENKIVDILLKIGFEFSWKGTRYICQCILTSIENNEENIKNLYQAVSKRTGCNQYTIKADIGTSINHMWNIADKEKVRKILRIGDYEKPSPKTIFYMVRYYIGR